MKTTQKFAPTYMKNTSLNNKRKEIAGVATAKAKVVKEKANAIIKKEQIKARMEKTAKAKVDAKEKAKQRRTTILAKYQAQQWIKHCIKSNLKNKETNLKGKRCEER